MMTGMISFDKDDDMGNTSKDLIRYRKSQNITETPADSVFPEDSEGPPSPGPHAVPFSLSITSDLFFFDTQPEPLDPVRQRLTVNRNGRIWFSEKLFWQWEMERSGPENGGMLPAGTLHFQSERKRRRRYFQCAIISSNQKAASLI